MLSHELINWVDKMLVAILKQYLLELMNELQISVLSVCIQDF